MRADLSGRLDLRGCRSVAECRFCFCEGLPDKTVVFLTVGPHDRAYTMR
jgi:hypothetical protein